MVKTNNKSGLTLVEVLISMILLVVMFMATTAIFVAGHRFYLSENDKVKIGYELRYAIEHISRSAMQGIGDKDNAAIVITGGTSERQFVIRHIDDDDPAAPPTYADFNDDKEVIYTITDDGKLSYSKTDLSSGAVLEQDTDMIPSVIILYSNDPVTGEQLSRFYLDDKTLCIKLTAQFPLMRAGTTREQNTLYGACAPRMSSYN